MIVEAMGVLDIILTSCVDPLEDAEVLVTRLNEEVARGDNLLQLVGDC